MNHPFPSILPLLRKIYRDRFSEVRFLVPFEQLPDEDVITVYRGSYNHAAYVTDARKELEALDCDYYLVIHDDVLLNPKVDERTFIDTFPIGPHDGFIPRIQPVPAELGQWIWYFGFVPKLFFPKSLLFGSGVEPHNLLKYLPDAETVRAGQQASNVHGTPHARFDPADMTDVARAPSRVLLHGLAANLREGTAEQDVIEAKSLEIERALVDVMLAAQRLQPDGTTGAANDCVGFPMPIVTSGYCADFYILPKSGLAKFCHYIGVASAANLFVEIMVPTLLYACCDRVWTGPDLGLDFSGFDEQKNLGWFADPKAVARHPIKLSSFRGEAEDAFVAILAAIKDDRPIPADLLARVGLGTPLDGATGSGWHVGEPWGVWASDIMADISIPLAEPSPVKVRLRAPLHETIQSLSGKLSFNDGQDELPFTVTAPDSEALLTIPMLEPDDRGVGQIRLFSFRLVEPSKLDTNILDPRSLGFGLISVEPVAAGS